MGPGVPADEIIDRHARLFQNNEYKGECAMDVRDYCDGMRAELTAWKARLFDVAVKADKLGTEEKGKVWEQFNDMKMLVAELEDKIEELRTECPSEWSPQKKEIENAAGDVRSRYEQTLEYIGKASPVSVPG